MDFTFPRGTLYPHRHLGRVLEDAINATIAASPGMDSVSSVGRWLGVERSKLHGWIYGRRLPKTDADRQALTRLGIAREHLESLCMRDRLEKFAADAGMEPGELIQIAADVERASGLTMDRLVELLANSEKGS